MEETAIITDEWLAGFIDGEGCLSITEGRRRGGSPDWKPVLVIANTNRAALDLIRDYIGYGNIHEVNMQRPEKHQVRWQFAIFGTKRLLPVLQRLRPHLIVKAGQADAMIAFMTQGDPSRPQHRLTETEVERRRAIRDHIRALNGRKLPAAA